MGFSGKLSDNIDRDVRSFNNYLKSPRYSQLRESFPQFDELWLMFIAKRENYSFNAILDALLESNPSSFPPDDFFNFLPLTSFNTQTTSSSVSSIPKQSTSAQPTMSSVNSHNNMNSPGLTRIQSKLPSIAPALVEQYFNKLDQDEEKTIQLFEFWLAADPLQNEMGLLEMMYSDLAVAAPPSRSQALPVSPATHNAPSGQIIHQPVVEPVFTSNRMDEAVPSRPVLISDRSEQFVHLSPSQAVQQQQQQQSDLFYSEQEQQPPAYHQGDPFQDPPPFPDISGVEQYDNNQSSQFWQEQPVAAPAAAADFHHQDRFYDAEPTAFVQTHHPSKRHGHPPSDSPLKSSVKIKQSTVKLPPTSAATTAAPTKMTNQAQQHHTRVNAPSYTIGRCLIRGEYVVDPLTNLKLYQNDQLELSQYQSEIGDKSANAQIECEFQNWIYSRNIILDFEPQQHEFTKQQFSKLSWADPQKQLYIVTLLLEAMLWPILWDDMIIRPKVSTHTNHIEQTTIAPCLTGIPKIHLLRTAQWLQDKMIALSESLTLADAANQLPIKEQFQACEQMNDYVQGFANLYIFLENNEMYTPIMNKLTINLADQSMQGANLFIAFFGVLFSVRFRFLYYIQHMNVKQRIHMIQQLSYMARYNDYTNLINPNIEGHCIDPMHQNVELNSIEFAPLNEQEQNNLRSYRNVAFCVPHLYHEQINAMKLPSALHFASLICPFSLNVKPQQLQNQTWAIPVKIYIIFKNTPEVQQQVKEMEQTVISLLQPYIVKSISKTSGILTLYFRFDQRARQHQ